MNVHVLKGSPSPRPTFIALNVIWKHASDHYCLSLTSLPTPDPYITFSPTQNKFYLTFTANNRIPLWEAPSLLDFYHSDRTTIGAIHKPPPHTPHSDRLWAPELHSLRGRWYIYFAAQDPSLGNKSHRMYVLRGPLACENPHRAEENWEFLGSIKGMDQRQWAIDGTVFELEEDGELYFVYSGWPVPPEQPWEEVEERLQYLFILRLSDPITAASSPVCISRPDQSWECTGPVGINEGPQWLQSPNGKWRGLVYSCGASWTKHYKMATLEFLGGDTLDPEAWRKSSKPLLQNAERGDSPFGPGHGNFLEIQGETLTLFHATDRDTDGNQGRKARLQVVEWKDDGPYLGDVVGRATRDAGLLRLEDILTIDA